MAHPTKTTTVLTILLLALTGIGAAIGTGKTYKNLKVLPQDISEKQLDSIMHAYNKALKVTCDFCHSKAKKDPFSLVPAKDELDFSLDNEMKENARQMIRMTIDINKRYFYFDSLVRPEYLKVVSCNSCHRGNPHPMDE